MENARGASYVLMRRFGSQRTVGGKYVTRTRAPNDAMRSGQSSFMSSPADTPAMAHKLYGLVTRRRRDGTDGAVDDGDETGGGGAPQGVPAERAVERDRHGHPAIG